MSSLLAQLGGNPFNTPVGQKIEQATDGSLASENWALNMEICDMLNESEEGPKDAVKAIRKRLQQNAGKNYTVVMYTLTVLETCVKNCGKRFHLLVTQKDFIQDLVKLIGPKNDPPTVVQEKVLSLIQCWAETFQSSNEMQGVVQMYTDLKQKGIEFPSPNVDTMAPILTPSRSVPITQPPGTQVVDPILPPTESSSPILESMMQPQQVAKLRKELDVVQGNMRVFGEMLTELTPGKEHPSDVELLQDLYRTCQSMQSRIVELLDRVGNEEITGQLLQVNDELNNLFLRYERFEKKRVAVSQNRPPPTAVKSPEEPKPLIDFGGNEANQDINSQIENLNLNAAAAAASSPVRNQNLTEDSEFDMLAQSRTIEHMKAGATTVATDQNKSRRPPVTDNQRDTADYKEMERWLKEEPESEVSASQATAANTGAHVMPQKKVT